MVNKMISLPSPSSADEMDMLGWGRYWHSVVPLRLHIRNIQSKGGWLKRSLPNSNFYLIGCSRESTHQFLHKQVESRNFYYMQFFFCYTYMDTNKFKGSFYSSGHIQNLLVMDWSAQFVILREKKINVSID